MSRLAALAALLLVAASPFQDPPGLKEPGDPVPRKGPAIPPPSKSPCCEEGRAKPWPLYNKGVQWTVPLDLAARKARESGKLLMVFHLVGDMSREGC